MAYCPPELLDDLADLFADVRTWVGVIQKRPGVFYAHGQPFLHFHLLAGGRRRADVKGRTDWYSSTFRGLSLPRGAAPWSVSCECAMARKQRGRAA